MGDLLNKALFNKTSIPLLGKLADLAALRQKLIASNIANVNTPGYQERQIDFDGELKKAIGKPKINAVVTNPRHIPLRVSQNAAPEVKSIEETENSTGVNSVDIEEQMAELAQNQLVFNFGATMLTKNFQGLKAAIRGRS
jgi:flagellar basal-body rod protein FlgB